jgi:hypothetical protein
MDEACFSLIFLITQNTFDLQRFLWLRSIPQTEYGKSIAMENVIIKSILYMEIKRGMYM